MDRFGTKLIDDAVITLWNNLYNTARDPIDLERWETRYKKLPEDVRIVHKLKGIDYKSKEAQNDILEIEEEYRQVKKRVERKEAQARNTLAPYRNTLGKKGARW